MMELSERKSENIAMFAGDAAASPAPARETAQTLVLTERKIIKNGSISFQTKNLAETGEFIVKAVNDMQGYISGDNVYNSDDRITRNITIRIPAQSFDLLLQRISENAQKLDSKNIYTQDVTEEFIDIEARLKTKKELESRYRQLLTQAKSVEDILAIEKEMGTLRSDIESIEGRLKFLNNQVNFSTLSVDFYQLTKSTLNFPSKIGHALGEGWRVFLAFLVGLIRLWPFILILVALSFVVIRYRKKK